MTDHGPTGRYRYQGEMFPLDEPPTRPSTPEAKRDTPPAGTVLDGPLTLAALRAELERFKREMISAVAAALEDARVVSDRRMYADLKDARQRISDLEQRAAQ